MKNEKVLQLVKILLNCDDFITINELAKKLELSQKTVRNYMKEVEVTLQGLELLKVPGQGIKINASRVERMQKLSTLDKLPIRVDRADRRGRIIYLLYVFLIKKQYVSIAYLENNLYISRPSIYKDLDTIETWLKEHEIRLMRERKSGFYLDIGEKRRRLAIFDWLIELGKYLESSGGCLENIEYLKQPIAYYHTLAGRNSFYRSQIEAILESVERELHFELNPIEFDKLSLMLAISVRRVSEHAYVTLSNQILNTLFRPEANDIVSILLRHFSHTFQINFPITEISYYSMLIIFSESAASLEGRNDTASSLEQLIANEYAQIVYQHYRIADRQTFEQRLAAHIKVTLNKRVFGQYHYNPMKETIQRNLPSIYQLTRDFIPIYEKYCNAELSEDELAYLTLHIVWAIENSKQPLRTLLIYSQSYSEGCFAAEYLQKNFAQLHIVRICSEKEYRKGGLPTVDLILSQMEIELEGCLKIVIPPIIGIEFVDKLALEIAKIYEETNRQRLLVHPEEMSLYQTY